MFIIWFFKNSVLKSTVGNGVVPSEKSVIVENYFGSSLVAFALSYKSKQKNSWSF